MINFIGQEFFDIKTEEKPDKNGSNFFITDIFYTDKIVFPEWKKNKNKDANESKDDSKPVSVRKPFVRVYSDRDSFTGANSQLFTSVTKSKKILSTVRMNSHITNQNRSDTFAVAIPFNGIIAPVKITCSEGLTCTIKKGALVKSDTPIESEYYGKSFSKILYLLLNIDTSIKAPDKIVAATKAKVDVGAIAPATTVNISYTYFCNSQTGSTHDMDVANDSSITIAYDIVATSKSRFLQFAHQYTQTKLTTRKFDPKEVPEPGTKLFKLDMSDAKYLTAPKKA